MDKIIYQKRRVGSGFNRVIELNQKMLIFWKDLLHKLICLCDDDNWIVYIILLWYKVVLFVKIWW